MGKFVFVYGTLKRNHGNHGLLHHSKFIGEAVTVSDGFFMYDGGFPWVVTKGQFYIKGELYELTDNGTLENLDRLEGVPWMYIRKDVHVRTEDGSIYEACMYVASAASEKRLNNHHTIQPNDDNICEWTR